MRAALLVLSACLAACASIAEEEAPVETPPPAPVQGFALGPQTLAPNQCGLFGWDNTTTFVFFATADRGLYAGQRGIVELRPGGDFPASDYGPVALELGSPDTMIDGTRYPYARVTEELEDGFTRVRPLVVLQTCQVPQAPL